VPSDAPRTSSGITGSVGTGHCLDVVTPGPAGATGAGKQSAVSAGAAGGGGLDFGAHLISVWIYRYRVDRGRTVAPVATIAEKHSVAALTTVGAVAPIAEKQPSAAAVAGHATSALGFGADKAIAVAGDEAPVWGIRGALAEQKVEQVTRGCQLNRGRLNSWFL
jgi:hypothetical protein